MPSQNIFWHRLESLRGIFALTVAVHHALLMLRGNDSEERILRGLQNVFYGHGAVLSFFVLSGLVLGQSLRRSSEATYWPFYLRRLLRIYPALIFSLLLACGLVSLVGFGKYFYGAATEFFDSLYNFHLSWELVLGNILFQNYALNNVTWTLWLEIVGSACLPLMHMLSRKPVHRICLILSLLALSLSPAKHMLIDAPSYLWVFYIGYLIPLVAGDFWLHLSRSRHFLIGGLVAALLVCWTTPHLGHHAIPYVLSIGFIVACIYHLPHERLFSFLDNCVVRFYGRISYSFYVLHFLVLYFIALKTFQIIPEKLLINHFFLSNFWLLLASIGLTTPLAYLSFVFVEQPFVRLGRKWSLPGSKP